ncbi:Ribosomal silencing factor RsfS [Poriferisphaera corsica]|uniref:Ribosomal silencing factor RsfS n=1 Tax=Poriferisphaera corsica TaxID=2528020 RepID=A0A517YQP2_9BACT|nr:ribosome silencing factor [Poriferisphaera corsica]QDU32543.1 Ribosomal silencing factor RsfS [Poriferisphaera corsica]
MSDKAVGSPEGVKDNVEKSESEDVKKFVIESARMLKDTHCEDVVVLDVCGVSQLTDYVVLASGTSDRQMRSVGDDIEQLAKKKYGMTRLGSERDPSITWLVLDFSSVMVHLFEPATRAHYDLELMWGDGKRVAWERDA